MSMEVYGYVWINESGREQALGIEPIAWTDVVECAWMWIWMLYGCVWMC
jgi:hypothetical protein